jgi:alkylation response protein AidB-like acyl-CoA dehydrogenase
MSQEEDSMTEQLTPNPYRFDAYLERRDSLDFYADDPMAQAVVRHYCGDRWEEVDREARALSRKVSFRWKDLAEAAALPEKRPAVQHFDAYGRRVDRIVRPLETELLEREVFSEALFSERTHPWVKLTKMFLIYQLGEACIACPVTCTEGLVALLDKFADSPELLRIRRHCKEGLDGRFAIGAQYLSEIQGGSDVPANRVGALEEGGTWRLYGTKFFCSATHADYAVVTAKPRGADSVALFVVPSWLPGDEPKGIRNGFTIDRLKWKMGTSELPTAEITFNGAVAYPVGPLERGLANVVGIVLTLSRLTVGLSSAAFMARAVREAKAYAQFREAFGQRIDRFPLVASQLAGMERTAQRTLAGAFRLYRSFLALPEGLKGGLAADEPDAVRKLRFDVRELIMLQKVTAAWDAPDVIRGAMSIFGGHGVMEDFSALPRLYRDAAVNELWEGPRNVLLTQIHRDLSRVRAWYPPAEFVGRILEGASEGLVKEISGEAEDLLSGPISHPVNGETMDRARRWDRFCQRLTQHYQELALEEVNQGR